MAVAHWFKFEHGCDNSKFTIGLAVAADMKELFWAIDEHVDPNAVYLIPAKRGSICRTYTEVGGDYLAMESESSEIEPEFDDPRWKRKAWPT
jgi:hypothetical protein